MSHAVADGHAGGSHRGNAPARPSHLLLGLVPLTSPLSPSPHWPSPTEGFPDRSMPTTPAWRWASASCTC
jgi:hypothetical protein